MLKKSLIIVLIIVLCSTLLFFINNSKKKKNDNQNDYIKYSFYKLENEKRYIRYQERYQLDMKDAIIRVNIGLDYPFYTHTEEALNQYTNYVLVNKYHYLDESYIPNNLVKLDNNLYLQKDAYNAFLKMSKDIEKEGLHIRIISAYRSYDYQKNLYNNYLKKDNASNVDLYSARAGYSEHQTGLAIDIDNYKVSYDDFDKTKEYNWMMNNSYKYGFILRYPKDKEKITGYMYEPWHYRYVGDISEYIYKNNLTYEEYYYEFLDK